MLFSYHFENKVAIKMANNVSIAPAVCIINKIAFTGSSSYGYTSIGLDNFQILYMYKAITNAANVIIIYVIIEKISVIVVNFIVMTRLCQGKSLSFLFLHHLFHILKM